MIMMIMMIYDVFSEPWFSDGNKLQMTMETKNQDRHWNTM
jgi:hypothetical protein